MGSGDSCPAAKPKARRRSHAGYHYLSCSTHRSLRRCDAVAWYGSVTAWCSAPWRAVHQVLAVCGWQINTAFVERINLTIRQHVAAVGRLVSTLCKSEEGLRQQLALYQTYHNFCLPHTSLRIPLGLPEPTNGTGSAKR